MFRCKSLIQPVLVVMALIMSAGTSLATGLLVPTDKSLSPLQIVYQRVDVEIHDQAAVTRVEQEFRNSTSRQLEAYYLFPLPAGAGVKDFAMWIDGKRTQAELVEASKARKVYEDIVRRLKDPGLLEHMGNDLWRVRVFPIPPRGRQKIEITYSQVAAKDSGIAEYVYPLKTSNQAVRTEEDFTVRVELHSSSALKSVYSPSHDVGVSKEGDHKATVGFEAHRFSLNRDFRLFWTTDDKEVGLSTLAYRESPGENGYFLMLLSPQVKLKRAKRVPRDLVFVLDTSGSMKGEKIEQAKKALKFCLKSLDPSDRFGLLGFSTAVNTFEEKLKDVSKGKIAKAAKWVEDLSAIGGTAIDDALKTALDMHTSESRNFTIVFLTDGQPTIGETNPKNILESVRKKNDSQTRIFVFGLGDNVNTHLLDQLAELTRATSVYVRPKEDLELKVSSFFAKISHPVFANLKLSVDDEDIRLTEMYPPKLPDLFHGGQLMVLGRYEGDGQTAIRLKGKLGNKTKEFVYEVSLPREKRKIDFLPGLWARRKVGYLLDQIRLRGKNKELVDEVIHLAKRYGIATPYTSYLIVPDDIPPIAGRPRRRPGPFPGPIVPLQERGGGYGGRRIWNRLTTPTGAFLRNPEIAGREEGTKRLSAARLSLSRALRDLDEARERKVSSATEELSIASKSQTGRHAVNVAQALADLKNAEVDAAHAVRKIGKTTFVNVGGVWIDQALAKESELLKVKYLGEAYFRILALIPEAKSIFSLGELVVWVTPSGKALAIDQTGVEKLTDEEIRELFGAKLADEKRATD